MEQTAIARYPLLEEVLRIKRQPLRAMYTNSDVAELFDVSVRTIQSHVSAGKLRNRKLIGSFRFLPEDLECSLMGTSV